MGFTRFTGFTVDWTTKATKISGQATNFKTWLNTRSAELLTWLEDTFLAELEQTTDGDSGADNIGMTKLANYGSAAAATAQAQAEALDAGLKALDVMTTQGDITYRGATVPARLAKGTALQVLQMNAGATAPEWASSPQSIMTAAGDLLYASSANTPARLAKGTAYQHLGMNAGATSPEWQPSANSVLTAAGDILYASDANTLARLAKGTDDQVLTLASGVPTWADASGGAETWTAVDAFTRASDATFTVTDDAAHQAIFVKGRPIRYKATGGSYVYGIVTGYTTGTVTLAGAPMTTSYDDVLEYGDMNWVVQADVMIPSSFASGGASSTLINTWLKSNLLWRYGAAYLVRFGVIVDVDDSGAAQTNVNVNIAGSAVGTANTNAGLTIAETWVYTTTDINTTNYSIAQDEEIEITCDATGTNDNARDLTASLTFVLA